MQRLYLARHGETEANRLKIIQGQNKRQTSTPGTYGDHLNPTGINQAIRLGKALADINFQSIYTSPAIRALDTERIVTFNNTYYWDEIFVGQVIPQVKDGLLEVDQGLFEGMTGDEIAIQYPELYNLYKRTPSKFTHPEGESMIEAKERVGRAIDRILRRDWSFAAPLDGASLAPSGREENILVISHGGTISLAFIHIFGLDMDRMYHAIHHHNCAFSIIKWPSPDAPPQIECINNVSHLK